MATSTDFVEPKRRLDRSLDKPQFNMLPTQDRSLVYQLRNAIEGVHNKVETLKDGIDDRYAEFWHLSSIMVSVDTSQSRMLCLVCGDDVVFATTFERFVKIKFGLFLWNLVANWPLSKSALLVADPCRSVYIAHKMASDGVEYTPIDRHFVSDIHWFV